LEGAVVVVALSVMIALVGRAYFAIAAHRASDAAPRR
jgi:hypothetical protein